MEASAEIWTRGYDYGRKPPISRKGRVIKKKGFETSSEVFTEVHVDRSRTGGDFL